MTENMPEEGGKDFAPFYFFSFSRLMQRIRGGLSLYYIVGKPVIGCWGSANSGGTRGGCDCGGAGYQ